MIRFYTKKTNEPLQTLDSPQHGCWVVIYPPFNREELEEISARLEVPIDYLFDSIDIDERSRYEDEDNVQLIVYNIPIKNEVRQDHEALYITIPLGIIKSPDYFITICAFDNPVTEYFLTKDVKALDTTKHTHFILLLFERTSYYFLNYLKSIDNQRNIYERELYYSSRNQELSKLMNIQKSLVYFLTTIRDNSAMLHKLQRTDFLGIRNQEDETDFFEDVMIEMSQAQEMAQIYTEILNGTMDAFASIISNNMNTIMKRLTSITVILMIPTLITSFYGMNVPLTGQNNPTASYAIISGAILTTAVVLWFFRWKKLF